MPEGVLAKLSPETLELVQMSTVHDIKSVVEQDVVTLS